MLDEGGRPVTDSSGKESVRNVKIGTWPAFLALVREPSGAVVGVHRTWITEDGRKPFEDWKGPGKRPACKRLAAKPDFLSISGCAIRLYDAKHALGVGEGIETMLGARLLMGLRQFGRRLPVWAGISATGLEAMQFPDWVHEKLVFADNDPIGSSLRRDCSVGRGEEAAWLMRNRVLDTGGAKVFLPPRVGTDWLDVYVEYTQHLDRINQRYREVWVPPEVLEQERVAADNRLAAELAAAAEDARTTPPLAVVEEAVEQDPAHSTHDLAPAPRESHADSDVSRGPVQSESGYKGRTKPHYVLKPSVELLGPTLD